MEYSIINMNDLIIVDINKIEWKIFNSLCKTILDHLSIKNGL